MTTLDFLKCCLPPPSTAQGSHTRFHVNYYCEVHDCSKRLKDESLNKFSRIWSSRVTLIQAWVAKKYSLSSDSCVQNDLLHFPCQHLRLSPCEGTKKQSRVSSIFFAAAGSSEYAKSFLESHSQVGDRKAVAYDSLQPEEPGFIHRTIKIVKVLKLKLQSFFDAFIIDRYLFREMVPPFLAALAVCSTLGMSLGALVSLVREAVISGVPLRIAVAASFLQLPRFLSQMMPVACMAAVLFSFTRFQGDKELLALYSVGIPMWRLLFAPLCLGMLAGVLKLACHEYLVPFSNGRAQGMVESALTSHLHNRHAREDIIYSEYGGSFCSNVLKNLRYKLHLLCTSFQYNA